MQLDALTLAALADEFQTTLVGARIDDVIQPTPQAVALQCWGGGRNRWLMLSIHPQLARLHFTTQKPRKLTAEPPAFVMLLRKYLEGARVVAVRQPRWERVIEIGFGRGAEIAAGTASVWLIVEVMGRNSNVTLTDGAAVILGALRMVSAEVNTYRAILPHVPYRYPPPQTRVLHGATLPRLDGADVTVSALREAGMDALAAYEAPPLAVGAALAPDAGDTDTGAGASTRGAHDESAGKPAGKGAGKPSAQQRKPKIRREAPTIAGLLAAQVMGFSRDLGAEVAFRLLGAPDAPLRADLGEAQWGAIARETRALAALPEAHSWAPMLLARGPGAPHVTREADGDVTPAPEAALIGFSVYRPQRFPPEITLVPVPSVNDALDRYFQGAEWQSALEGAKGGLRRLLQTHYDRCQRKAEHLRTELGALDELSRLRLEADTLLTYQTEIAPGQRVFTVTDPFGAGENTPGSGGDPALTITLDPQLTPVENATRRYDRYHKLQRAGEQIPPQIAANALELARIEQMQTDLALAETPAEVSHVRAEVAEAGYIRSGLEARRLAKEQRGKKGKGAKGGKAGKGGKPGKPGAARAPEGGAPLRRRIAGGFVALVGKNSRQNEEVTFREAAPNDLWLHARGAPGAHVIIKSGGRPAPEATLQAAASLAGYYSQLRSAGSVAVDYTERRYVRHMQGGGPGMVVYERERTLHAPPTDVGEAL